ncbi:hypothetical protein [Mucilaginibacter terrenus]|nr:hypothetical protein [Mucilaginibacter terrenus]
MKKISTKLLLLMLIVASGQRAFAGWPVGKYRNIVVPSFNYYTSKDTYNSQGKKVKGAPGTYFNSFAYGVYFAHGLTRRLDLIVNVLAPNQISNSATDAGNLYQEAFGLGDMQVGLSYALVNFDYKAYFSVQVSGIVPLYKNEDTGLDLGYGSYGSEVKFMYTGGFNGNFLKGCYYNVETGYRRYFDHQGPNVVLYSALLGVPLNKRNQVSFEIGGQNSSSSNKTFNANLSVNRDFAFTKGSINYGHTFSRRLSLFANGFYTFMGRNSGVGYGGALQAVVKI